MLRAPLPSASLIVALLTAMSLGCASARSRAGADRGAEAPQAGRPDLPVVREIEFPGAEAFPRETLLKYARIRPGARLRRTATEVAADLETRYRIAGYLAALVTGAFDPTSSRLTLTVDEGRLAEIEIDGVDGDAEARVRELLALEVGKVVREKDVRAGLVRVEDVSTGAFTRTGDPPYTVERIPAGVRLRLTLQRNSTRLVLWPRGPDLSPLTNRVEGIAPSVSAGLTVFDHTSLNHADLYARLSYGTASGDARYAVGARRPFGAQRFVLGAEVHDLTDTDDHFRRHLVAEPRGRALLFSITEDYYRRRGYEAYAFARPLAGLHIGATWRSDSHEGLAVEAKDRLFFLPREARPNPGAGEGRVNAILLTARYAAKGDLFSSWSEERESFLVQDPYGTRFDEAQGLRAEATLESAEGGLGSDFEYRRLITHLRVFRPLGAKHGLRARALIGVTGGEPPRQRTFALGGAGTLRGYALKEFQGRNMALLTGEWSYALPSRFPGLVAFYDGGTVWTDGVTGAGWRDDVGVGLQWPGGGRETLRVDVALPLRRTSGQDAVRVHALLRLPF